MKKSNLLWGIAFVIVGLIICLNTFQITNIDIFFEGWWTLFIIVPSFINIFTDDDKVASFIWMLVGILLFLLVNDYIPFELISKLIFPFILIAIGFALILKGTGNGRVKKIEKIVEEDEEEDSKDNEQHSIFYDKKIHAEKNFDGVELNSVFGSLVYDLSDSKVKNKSVINAKSVFGNIKIIVPSNVKLVVKNSSFVSEVINHVKNETAKTILYINVDSCFGSVIIDEK